MTASEKPTTMIDRQLRATTGRSRLPFTWHTGMMLNGRQGQF